MSRALRVLAVALALLCGGAGSGLATAPEAAAVQARGKPGFCPDGRGVTVVVDFRELGGTTLVRCAVGGQSSGLAALKAAGFRVAGTSRWGESFVCRLEGKPGAGREPCVDTPPTKAYWSYWHASNGGRWTYSQQGATYRTPPQGSFEGWSFSLNRPEGAAPAPRVAPRRPAAGGSGSGSGNGANGGNGGGGAPAPGGGGNGPAAGSGSGSGSTGGGPAAPGRDGGRGGDAAPGAGTGRGGGAGDGADGGQRGDGRRGPDQDGRGGKSGKSEESPSASSSASPSPGASDSGSPGPAVSPTEAADWSGGENRRALDETGSSGPPTDTLFGIGMATLLVAGAAVAAWRRRAAAPKTGASGAPGASGASGGGPREPEGPE
ncbi:hypothetical protein [Streptomyces boncukensis]|uniref:hypothetical protein n=1 Tax=Streptomyces boncukensis TaxID=2711219 RepID=UPI001F49B716|nr:hypothetical protein [Streptomyces boncukensis]